MVLAFVTKGALAILSPSKSVYSVSIEGTTYGEFREIDGLDKIFSLEEQSKLPFNGTMVFQRNFIAEPSLYKWALDNQKTYNTDPLDICIELGNRDNLGHSRVILKDVKPISWALKANQANSGGYYEKIAVVYQDIEFY